jgi:ATP-dependent exoDNAse (exonuclease V) beta subunit
MEWWQCSSRENSEAYIKRQLVRSGLSPARLPQAIKGIHTIIERALQDARGRWILSQHQDSQSEYQLSFTSKDGIENIIIDRTFIDEHGTRWIIDYKTAENQDDEIDVFLQKQKEKYAGQMRKYQQAIANTETRAIKCGLYFPAIPAWLEWS